MRRLALAVALFLGLSGSAWAGFEHGKAAYERGDYTMALEEWLPLAEQGHVKAQWQLGRLYGYGWGVSRSSTEAEKWFGLAAAQSRAVRKYILALSYEGGWLVPRDDSAAVKWYRLAAEQGLAGAQYKLGLRYNYGEGVPQDYAEAVKWYNLAASRLQPGGDREIAVENRDMVESRMTTAQVAEAQRLARDWMETHGKKQPADSP